MKALYFESITLIERLHYLFLDVMKSELDRMRIFDINNVQCFILYNVGKNEMTVGELSNRGYYLGSNVSYNLKKLVEHGYFIQEKAKHDKRSSKVHLSEKGLKLYDKIDKIFTQQSTNLKYNGIVDQNLTETLKLLRKIESYWNFIISHGLVE
ncbi:MAG: transcriptional regulator [uncultured bacterium]|nr:MAG: transcriptional regulator [uncultured bacterium]OFW69573.1 MAG: MarR family transcriptional regulator [Alphaproteobacteria bacterium GWC2_42_16]OFW74097.1 MAG: MarR family transcriptional regulator [Alphaproteobacteria bacterium GWA2_41_27]OFW84405.1 MAG: MarR family transcriptional regulator [Alphaproteobacteria bacterium RIFCSPHIGHO2_12_FULL_42_100]OFW85926.1 MAG: MarR family transcriptional regulator [Alphaproteobacteria bacterium RBG_16_42_14]OFW92252.1 MAG: MarR family transcripti